MPDGISFDSEANRSASPLLGISQRLPPSNLQAEQALLGALLANNKAFDRVGTFLRPEHFADPLHGKIYAAIAFRIANGKLADAVTLKTEFENSGQLEDVGGTAYLGKLLSAIVGILNAGEYGNAIYDCWLRRQIIDIGEKAVNDAFGLSAEVDAEAILSRTVEQLLALGEETSTSQAKGKPIGQAMLGVLEDIRQIETRGKVGLMTGIARLDDRWRGLWPGTLDILAGRPGEGKTALALQISANIAEELMAEACGGKPARGVSFFSLEMSAKALGARLLSMRTGFATDNIREGKADINALTNVQHALYDLPILIHDKPKTLAQIELQARIDNRRRRTALVVIDHSGKIKRDKHDMRMNETEWLNHVASECHDLSIVLDVPVLLLWHLKRLDDQRPRLEDLKYAGEGDADNALLIWRPEKYQPPEPKRGPTEKDGPFNQRLFAWEAERKRWAGRAELIFAKRRSGPTGSLELVFDGKGTRFVEPIEEEPPPNTGG